MKKKKSDALAPVKERVIIPNGELPMQPVIYSAELIASATAYALEELQAAQGFPCDSDDACALYAENLREAKGKAAQLEAARVATVAPINAAHDAVQLLYKEPKTALQGLITFVERRIKDWTIAKEVARQKAMRAAAEAAEARDGAALTEALQANAAMQKTKLQGVAVIPKWVGVIINPGLVIREFCSPDQKLIDQHAKRFAIDEQPSPVPGVRFELDAGMRTQSK